jgi:1,2-diacylglycerol 3-alpha-glucosyltransferase
MAVIFHRFGPYHCVRLKAAARCCDFIAIEVAAETQEYAWSPVNDTENYSRLTLFPSGDTRTMSVKRISTRVENALRNCASDAVAIPGWSESAAIAALRWCADTGTPAILMSESTALDEPRVTWREWIKRRIVDLYSTALVGGQRHIDYLISLGMPRDRIFTGYDVVDNDYFARSATEIRKSKVEIRKQYRLPENYFLASARFIPKKNLPFLLRAYAEYRGKVESAKSKVENSKAKPWNLVLLGDGPLRETLNSQLSTLNLHDCVLLPGFKQYEELPVYYGLANAFVHASTTEQWGLVVNEAIASGLPVIVSNRCGCVPELVRDGVNGWTFDPCNQQELSNRLMQVATLREEERENFAIASRRIISPRGPEQFGFGLVAAAQLALQAPRLPSMFSRAAVKMAFLFC